MGNHILKDEIHCIIDNISASDSIAS